MCSRVSRVRLRVLRARNMAALRALPERSERAVNLRVVRSADVLVCVRARARVYPSGDAYAPVKFVSRRDTASFFLSH